jgi:diguanylate cyclase (GGDEF)-like protein/PAS domain S-box-containing protein
MNPSPLVPAGLPDALSALEAMLEISSDGVLLTDRAGRVVAWNRRLLDLWRVPPALERDPEPGALLAHAATQMADRGALPARVRELCADPEASGHALLEFADGRVFEAYTRPQRRSGRVVGRAWSFVDVSENRLVEAVVRRGEERYRLAAEGASEALWEWDLGTDELHLSPRGLELLGTDPAGAPRSGTAWAAWIHPDDAAAFRARVEAHCAGETDHLLSEHRTRHARGGYRWTRVRGVAVRDAGGRALRMAGSQADVTEIRGNEERLRRDALTGLMHRAAFLERAAGVLRGGAPAAVLVVDLDSFQLFNESLGPAAGDALLAAAADRLRASVGPGDAVARLGGDEFGVLLEGATAAAADGVAEGVRRALSPPFRLDGRDLFATACVGLALARPGDAAEDALRDATIALHRAKALGPGRHQRFDPAMREQPLARLRLAGDLRHALAHDELFLAYQPIVELATGTVRGFEALVRWRHPSLGLLSPAEFISVAEETGLIVPLGEWVMGEACRQAARWREEHGPTAPGVAINVSARQLAHPELAAQVRAALRAAGLPPAGLRLEVTESLLATDLPRVSALLGELKAEGVGISVDDFGTGYSSLAYLHRLPADTLKVDRSFVLRMGAGRESTEIVRTILALGRSLGMRVVAEGVETPAQRAALEALGCEQAQGYLFSPAVAGAAADALVRRAWPAAPVAVAG